VSFDINAIFEKELARRKLAFVRQSENEYRVEIDGAPFAISLANIRRNALRDDDAEAVQRFARDVLGPSLRHRRAWQEAAPFLLFSAEAADHDFGTTIRSSVSPEVCRVLTLTDENHTTITWVTEGQLTTWGVAADVAIAAALANQDTLLHGVEVQVEEVRGSKLGMVPLESPYKASVIFAPAFERLVGAEFGWPVLAVVPCRDFIYVLSEGSPLLSQLGAVVVREFRTSGYAITTEVLRIADDGISAIGKYPVG
jgi:hypothetical protein